MWKEILCGIYAIRNLVNGNFYIGSSNNIWRRWGHHKSLLRRGISKSKHLQSAWNKYGEGNFEFELLFLCQREELLDTEAKFVTTLKPAYNLAKVGDSKYAIEDHPNKDFLRERYKSNTVKRRLSRTEEQAKAHSDRMRGDKNPNWKRRNYLSSLSCMRKTN